MWSLSESADLVESRARYDVRLNLRQVIRSDQRSSIRNQQVPVVYCFMSRDISA